MDSIEVDWEAALQNMGRIKVVLTIAARNSQRSHVAGVRRWCGSTWNWMHSQGTSSFSFCWSPARSRQNSVLD